MVGYLGYEQNDGQMTYLVCVTIHESDKWFQFFIDYSTSYGTTSMYDILVSHRGGKDTWRR